MIQVLGGGGLLGSNIVRFLKARGEPHVTIVDLRSPTAPGLEKVAFESADITSADSLQALFLKLRPDVVHHTVSPVATANDRSAALFEKVNVGGTVNVIEACQKAEVKKLIFTSSASVVYNDQDLINVDERMPYPEKNRDPYMDTKARAEQLVLLASTKEGTTGLKTCALRPAGIYGPGDIQYIPGLIEVCKTGRNKFQVGDNQNLWDVTYVDNIAHAHLLAADRLSRKPYSAELMASVHLPPKCLGEEERGDIRERDVPTSEKREAVQGAPDYAQELPSTLPASVTQGQGSEDGTPTLDLRPVIRNRYDQFFHIVNPDVASAGNPIPEVVSIAEESVGVAGNAFFITNGQPTPFWDFARAVWKEYDPSPKGTVDLKKVWKIPRDVGMVLATLAEYATWLVGTTTNFTRFKISFSATTRFYNIERARRVLGYEPLVGTEEGVKRSVQWYKEQESKGTAPKAKV